MKRALVGIVTVALFATGCGNSTAEADVRRFCELVKAYNKGTGFQAPEDDSPEALAKALRDYLTLPEVASILDELADVAPDQVRADVETMVGVAEELVDSGKSRFEEPDAVEANNRIVEFTTAECAEPSPSPSASASTDPAQPTSSEPAAEQSAEQS